MYHITETVITVSILYLISFILYRLGVLTHNHHRRFWNSILAFSFLFTALAGLFMALQINFKWELPFIKQLLKWHVEIGAILALAGIFHLLWHFSYYLSIFTKTEYSQLPQGYVCRDPVILKANLFIAGIVSTSIQLVMIKEIMNISGGYELIAGIFLGSWLIGSAIGAASGANSPLSDIRKINIIFAGSQVVTLTLLILLARLFPGSGETPSILVSLIITFLVLLPFCLVSGFTFIKLIFLTRDLQEYDPGRSFSIETTGAIAAGVLSSFVISGWLGNYKTLLIVILMSFTWTLLAFYRTGIRTRIVIKVASLIIFTSLLATDADIFFRQLLLKGIEISETRDTPYGNITRGEYAGEESIYYNQRLITYNDDVVEREENIHYALLQRARPESVILISGSLKSHLPELIKYPIKKIIYLENDPELIRITMPASLPGNLSLEAENKDAFRYFKKKNEKVDAVILLLPPPSTLSLNRFYTSEFFSEVKDRLNPGGIFMCSPGPGDNYLNKESAELYSSVYNTLKANFRFVSPVAGNKLYFISSDSEISVSFCALTEIRKITNTYVGPDYMADDLILIKSNEVLGAMIPGIRQNHSSFPIACFYYQSYNLSRNAGEKIPVLLLMILAFVLPVVTIRRSNFLIYYCASALAGFEIIILITMQLTIGNMYRMTGVVIAVLMTGMAAGAAIKSRRLGSISMRTKALIMIIFYLIIAAAYNVLLSLESTWVVTTILIISTLIPAFITGHIFRQLTKPGNTLSTPASAYSSDLAGSAFGFILISAVTIPLLGIRSSLVLLALLILAGVLPGTGNVKE